MIYKRQRQTQRYYCRNAIHKTDDEVHLLNKSLKGEMRNGTCTKFGRYIYATKNRQQEELFTPMKMLMNDTIQKKPLHASVPCGVPIQENTDPPSEGPIDHKHTKPNPSLK